MDWNESDHPRASDGKFGNGGSTAGNAGRPDLTAKENKTLSEYGEGNAYNVNKYLKDPKAGKAEAKANFGSRAAEYTKSIEADAKTIDGAIAKATLSDDTKLFRGVSDFAHIREVVSGLKPGETFSLPTFSSTSRSEKWAKGFMEGKSGDKGMIIIDAKAGANGLDMDAHARHKGDEQEVLLGRNAPFKFERYDAETNTVHVSLEPRPADTRNDSAPRGAELSYTIEGRQMIKAAGILFVTSKLEALYLKRGNGGDYPLMWNLPGGRLEEGETAIEAAIRETVEEAGYETKAEDLKLWTRRVAQHETAGPAPTPDEGQIEPSVVEPILNAPGNAFMATGPEVDFTTFICQVSETFTPTINDESIGYAWSPIDQAPEPLHPGVRVALDRFGMDELGIARAMQAGDLTSPQFYENVGIFDIRISGTGDAYRSGIEEFVYRPPEAWLNPDLLDRYNGLPVIWVHPPDEKPVLDTTEFAERIVGTVMLPYVKGDEVWGISKVWDMPAANIMAERQLSTSPGVLFRGKGTNTKLKLEDGRSLVIEGNPDLVDHVAICDVGVWDKGGAPAGVKSSEITGDADMTMEDAARKDADKETEIEKKEDRKDADLDKFLSKMDAMCARMDAMEASMKDRKDSDDKEAKCDADDKEDEDKKDRKDAKKDGEGDPMMTAADKKDAEDDKEEEKKDARKDAEISDLKSRLAALEHRTKPIAETDRALFAKAQARADGVMQAFGDSAPRQMQGETILDYRRRLLNPLLKHSVAWKGVDISALPETALGVAEDQVYKDAALSARSPSDIPSGTLRALARRDGTGRTITEFAGEPRAWMSSFTSGKRGLTGINTKHQGA